jgi:hypothetical protein
MVYTKFIEGNKRDIDRMIVMFIENLQVNEEFNSTHSKILKDRKVREEMKKK